MSFFSLLETLIGLPGSDFYFNVTEGTNLEIQTNSITKLLYHKMKKPCRA